MTTKDNLAQPKIKVGILVDSPVQPRWVYSIIENIQRSNFAEVVLVVRNLAHEQQQSAKPTRFGSYWKNRSYLLYALYNKYDEFRFKTELDAFEQLNLKDLIGDIPVLDVDPVMKKFSDWFPADAVEQILEHDLDVALRFGFRVLKGDVLRIAKHGVWSYHHGDNRVNRGGPAGFWEVLEGEPVTGSILQVLTEDLDNGKVLARSWAPTSDRFSASGNRNNYFWKTAPLMLVKLKELYEKGEVAVQDEESFEPYSERLYKEPTNRELFTPLLKLTARYAHSKIASLTRFDQWVLAYKFRSNPGDANTVFYRYDYIIPPKDRFWADPFPVKSGDKYYIFLEEYIYDTAKGTIAVLEIDKGGKWSEPVTVLERPYHLSYPFIFEWQNEHYMIPETGGNQTVEMYRCVSFPNEWELAAVLLEGLDVSDATLHESDGTWWMFVNVSNEGVVCGWDELHLYYSDRPDGEWTPHPQNPVKLDVRSSRPAGRLFQWNGDLYRPSQDCSRNYGYAITINKIVKLNKHEFLEEEVSKILPRWDSRLVGTHTLNTADDLTVIDCLMRTRK